MTLTDKQTTDYEDTENCFGKMYDGDEPDCTSCVDCDVCKELASGKKPSTPKEVSKPSSKVKVTREIVIGIFNEVMDANKTKHEVVSAANHDKLYMSGDYLGKATTTALYIHGDDSVKYSDLTVEDVKYIFDNVGFETEEEEPTEDTKEEKVEKPVVKIDMMYTVEDIQNMTVRDFVRLVMQ